MLKEFKQFILRGNVIDLAVAVVIGAAFNNVVQGLVKDFITPLVGAVYQQKSFANASFHFHGATFMYGDFVNTFISFVLVAAVVFFLVVQPINKLVEISKRNDDTADPTTKKCPECYSEIPFKATRCPFCTTKIEDKSASKKKD
jgi:large conductance mechanosensitive channel